MWPICTLGAAYVTVCLSWQMIRMPSLIDSLAGDNCLSKQKSLTDISIAPEDALVASIWLSQILCLLYCVLGYSVVSDSLQPHGLWPARLLCPWNFPGRNTGWVDISSSRGSFHPRDRTHISYISCTGSRFFTTEPPGKPYQPVHPPKWALRTLNIFNICVPHSLITSITTGTLSASVFTYHVSPEHSKVCPKVLLN